MKPAHLWQTADAVWEVRTEAGSLAAFITADPETGAFHVSAGLDMESEFFRTFSEACAYAFGGAP